MGQHELNQKMVLGGGRGITPSTTTKTTPLVQGILAGINTATSLNARAAEKANSISEEAQKQAMDFNKQMAEYTTAQNWAMMNAANAFQAAQAQQANDFSQMMWNNTANFNAQQQAQAMNYNSAEAERQRQWQENMSNTSYQRAVEDLRKAGLNPVLALMNGGASTPGGASGSIGGTSVGSISGQQAAAHMNSSGSANVSGYTGILENTSNELALVGAIVSGLNTASKAMTELGGPTLAEKIFNPKNSAIVQADKKIWEDIKGFIGKLFGKK